MRRMELYIHIPFCVKKCPYCDFLSLHATEDTQREYVEALLREIAFYGPRYRDYLVTTVYIGGGTPSWLFEEHIARIMGTVHRVFTVASDAEISIECNPGTVTAPKLAVYREAGINRLSIGCQSADNVELKVLGRIHTFEQFLKTYGLAREAGFDNISVDLINALPGQTAERFSYSLQQVLRLKPEHISVYSLMIEKGTPFYDLYKFDAVKQQAGLPTEALPTEDEVYRIDRLTGQTLAEAGYERYEVSNYAKRGYECRHNIGYWERENYLGVGLGAASLIENIRYSNIPDLYRYLRESHYIREGLWETGEEDLPATNLHADVSRIKRKGQIEEFMFLGLRMIQGISRENFARAFGVQIEAIYQGILDELAEEGLLKRHAGRIFLTEHGQDLSNYVLSKFLLS